MCGEIVHVHYLGHAAFVLRFGNITVLMDYGKPNAWVQWGWDSPIHDIGALVPELAAYSHTHHEDHYDPDRLSGDKVRVLKDAEPWAGAGLEIEAIRTCEQQLGAQDNTSYLFRYAGLSVLHLGDCQANIMAIDDPANRQRLRELLPGPYDLLLMPIEGQQKFIPQAEAFLRQVHPRRVIPMHYWSAAYKQEFLAYLTAQNTTGAQRYRITHFGGADYAFSSGHDEDMEIQVIVLEPGPYPA